MDFVIPFISVALTFILLVIAVDSRYVLVSVNVVEPLQLVLGYSARLVVIGTSNVGNILLGLVFIWALLLAIEPLKVTLLNIARLGSRQVWIDVWGNSYL